VEKLKSTKTAPDDVDALFELPLSEFTAARNALAARLKKAGNAAEANRVKSLAKPSVAAWAVNQLFWKHRIAFDRLLDAGERFRNAQTAQLAGKSADLRAPLEARRVALSELSTHAARILAEGGNAATPDTMRRVTTTLEALSTYAGIPDTPVPGRLMDDVQPPGFEALAALVPRVGSERSGGPTRVIPFEFKQPSRKPAARKSTDAVDEKARAAERKAQVAAARAAIQEAERTLRDARKAAQKAEEELKKAAARAKEADAEKQKLEQQFEKLTAQADEARKNARAVAAAAEGAAQEVEDAERALEKANRALEALAED
jgi:DNA repair exonuclease SbcCD ATPase subunit